jgi:hypothetical protein
MNEIALIEQLGEIQEKARQLFDQLQEVRGFL